jgi:SAM-dependent methyltransferase
MEVTCERFTVGHFSGVIEQEHLERYRYASALVRGLHVADIACGTGYGSRLLADAGAASVSGFDVSGEAVKFAQEKYGNDKVSYKVADATDLADVPTAKFDVVVSFETIEHLQDTARYLSELQRVLKPGGIFLVSTPERRLSSTLYPLRGRPNNPYHVREYTRDEFVHLLQTRFEVVECLGQAYISAVLAFWPLQVALKGLCYLLRGLGAYKLIEKHYHVGTGLSVKPAAKHPRRLARFWILRCVRRESGGSAQPTQ